jgi:hypothetical protein
MQIIAIEHTSLVKANLPLKSNVLLLLLPLLPDRYCVNEKRVKIVGIA